MMLRKLRPGTSYNTSTGGKLSSEHYIGWDRSWEVAELQAYLKHIQLRAL